MAEDTWIMRGLDWDNPYRIRTWQELVNWINEVGFLPLFRNDVPGFSAEEHVSSLFWWTGDPEQDPWEWREIIARSHQVAYGKFFDKKAGFISLDWLPYFVNFRRDGYDFDSRWEDGLANRREKSVIDLVTGRDDDGDMIFPDIRILSTDLKKKAGFGKEGEKNYPGIVTGLQMQTYYENVTKAYDEKPVESWERIVDRVKECFPGAEGKGLEKLIGKRPER